MTQRQLNVEKYYAVRLVIDSRRTPEIISVTVLADSSSTAFLRTYHVFRDYIKDPEFYTRMHVLRDYEMTCDL